MRIEVNQGQDSNKLPNKNRSVIKENTNIHIRLEISAQAEPEVNKWWLKPSITQWPLPLRGTRSVRVGATSANAKRWGLGPWGRSGRQAEAYAVDLGPRLVKRTRTAAHNLSVMTHQQCVWTKLCFAYPIILPVFHVCWIKPILVFSSSSRCSVTLTI